MVWAMAVHTGLAGAGPQVYDYSPVRLRPRIRQAKLILAMNGQLAEGAKLAH